jgi:hypothetical protein
METIEVIAPKIAAGQLLGLREFVFTLYRADGVADVPALEVVRDAFARAEQKHPDMVNLRGEMCFVESGLIPIWARITLDRYIEFLYRVGVEYSKQVREATPMAPVILQ